MHATNVETNMIKRNKLDEISLIIIKSSGGRHNKNMAVTQVNQKLHTRPPRFVYPPSPSSSSSSSSDDEDEDANDEEEDDRDMEIAHQLDPDRTHR